MPDLEMLAKGEASSLEPLLRCEAALLSPSTGIFDSHSYMQHLLNDAETHGASLAVNCRVIGGDLSRGGDKVHVNRVLTFLEDAQFSCQHCKYVLTRVIYMHGTL